MDIAKYFDNINKNILLKIIERKIKDKDVLWLIKEILYSQKREKGLEIGNYTSQMFANIYLNEIDQFIKHKLHIKYYVRYMDDFLLFDDSKEKLKIFLTQIENFCKNELILELKPPVLGNCKNGDSFLGYIIKSDYVKLNKKSSKNAYDLWCKHELN